MSTKSYYKSEVKQFKGITRIVNKTFLHENSKPYNVLGLVNSSKQLYIFNALGNT